MRAEQGRPLRRLAEVRPASAAAPSPPSRVQDLCWPCNAEHLFALGTAAFLWMGEPKTGRCSGFLKGN